MFRGVHERHYFIKISAWYLNCRPECATPGPAPDPKMRSDVPRRRSGVPRRAGYEDHVFWNLDHPFWMASQYWRNANAAPYIRRVNDAWLTKAVFLCSAAVTVTKTIVFSVPRRAEKKGRRKPPKGSCLNPKKHVPRIGFSVKRQNGSFRNHVNCWSWLPEDVPRAEFPSGMYSFVYIEWHV